MFSLKRNWIFFWKCGIIILTAIQYRLTRS
nr:MAG TPA: hypothetical protein [Caudoviricetes sp.]